MVGVTELTQWHEGKKVNKNLPGGSGEVADAALTAAVVLADDDDDGLAKFMGTDEIRALGKIVFIRSASSG